MKSSIAVLALVLFAGVASAQPQAQIGASNQIVDNGSITVNDVYLSQPGFVSVSVPDSYGNANSNTILGSVYLSAGHHEDVNVPLNAQVMSDNGYGGGIEQKAFVEVTPKVNLASAGDQEDAHSTTPSDHSISVKAIEIMPPNKLGGGN